MMYGMSLRIFYADYHSVPDARINALIHNLHQMMRWRMMQNPSQ